MKLASGLFRRLVCRDNRTDMQDIRSDPFEDNRIVWTTLERAYSGDRVGIAATGFAW
jgi:hypothetical protein